MKMQCVYVILASDNSVKIGITQNPKKRFNTIRTSSGKNLLETYNTDFCSNAGAIESLMKKKYRDKNINGEWFDISYPEAVTTLKTMFKEKAKFEEKTEKNSDWIDDAVDFGTGFTQVINKATLVDIYGVCTEEQIEKIEKNILLLNRYLLKKHTENQTLKFPFSLFKSLFGIAYQMIGVNTADKLKGLDVSQIQLVYLLEKSISESIPAGIKADMNYTEIHKSCEKRCAETFREYLEQAI